jgi:hypothetical protein
MRMVAGGVVISLSKNLLRQRQYVLYVMSTHKVAWADGS